MDAVSYSHSAKQAQRIEKFIENPDSTSGVLTQPSVIQTGETVNVPVGRTAILANTKIDGTLTVDGTVFIPSGATLDGVVEKVASTDNAIARFDGVTGQVQNSSVIIDDNGKLLLTSGTGALGYGTGAGGTVTQLTSKSTAVTLNKPSGVIIMNAAALAGGTGATFQFNNSLLSSMDNLVCTFYALSLSNQGVYTLEKSILDGVAFITVTNRGTTTFSDNIYINFSVIKGANS